jgi:hypothetical protein
LVASDRLGRVTGAIARRVVVDLTVAVVVEAVARLERSRMGGRRAVVAVEEGMGARRRRGIAVAVSIAIDALTDRDWHAARDEARDERRKAHGVLP